MSKITITISDSDQVLFDFIKGCKDERYMKEHLKSAVELYNYAVGDTGELPGFLTPEKYRVNKLVNLNKNELIKLREQFLNNLLLFAQDFHPDEVDCGILRGPDDDYWFIDDGAKLGYIALYSHYIKEIDDVLKTKN